MTFGGAETDHRSGAVLTSLHVCVASLDSAAVVVVVAVAVVVTPSDSRTSLTRGGAETTVTLASVMSDLVRERKLRNLRLENDDCDERAGDVLLVTRAGRALKGK